MNKKPFSFTISTAKPKAHQNQCCAATENNDQIKRIICKQLSDHCFIRLLQIIVVMPETPGGAIFTATIHADHQ